jgi:hypothetical protein
MKAKEKISAIKELTANAIKEANEAAKKYSNDPQSQLAFEVGYLNSIIKNIAAFLEE